MDLFKLVGSIFINNKEANSQIDETNTKAQNLATKIGSVMETAGKKSNCTCVSSFDRCIDCINKKCIRFSKWHG